LHAGRPRNKIHPLPEKVLQGKNKFFPHCKLLLCITGDTMKRPKGTLLVIKLIGYFGQ